MYKNKFIIIAVILLLEFVVIYLISNPPLGNEELEKIADSAAKTGKIGRAVRFYGYALEKEPNNAELYYKRALGYEKLGMNGNAELDLNEAVAIEPNNAKYRIERLNIKRVYETADSKEIYGILKLEIKTKKEYLILLNHFKKFYYTVYNNELETFVDFEYIEDVETIKKEIEMIRQETGMEKPDYPFCIDDIIEEIKDKVQNRVKEKCIKQFSDIKDIKEKEQINAEYISDISKISELIKKGNIDLYERRGDLYYVKYKYDIAIKDYERAVKEAPYSQSRFDKRGMCYLKNNKLWSALMDNITYKILRNKWRNENGI